MQPVLYAWNFSAIRRESLHAVCGQLGIRLRAVAPAEARLPLGSLPASPPASGPAMMPFPEEMLLMAFFPDAVLDRFLAALRSFGLAPVPLKAILTPTNAGWDSIRLHRELSAESAGFRQRPHP